MAKRIEANDVYAPGIFDGYIKSAEEALKTNNALRESLKANLVIFKEALLAFKSFDAKSIKDFNKAMGESAAVLKQLEKLKQEQARTEAILNKVLQENEKLQQQMLKTQAQKNKLDEQAAKNAKKKAEEERKLNSVYEQSKKALNDVSKRLIEHELKGRTTSATYKLLRAEFERLNTAVRSAEQSVGRFQRNVGNYPDLFIKAEQASKRFGNSLLTIAGIGGGTAILHSIIHSIIQYDESLADLQKTTNTTKEEAAGLVKELMKLDTRTSIDNLTQLASAAGRLGLRGKDIIDFTREVDKAFVALGDSLEGSAEEIGLTLGKIASVYGIEDQYGIGEAINKVGSSLNELGANAKIQEKNIVDFTNRLAGVASQAKISAPDIQALGALFDENGQSMEVAASTINALLPAIGKDVEKFARVAGKDVKEFSQTLKTNAFEALKQVAAGAKSTDGGLIGLTKTLENYGIESARSSGIVGVLSGKLDRLNELQQISNKAFTDGVSLSNEYEIKNNTLGASIEKLQNEWTKFVIRLNEADSAGSKLKSAIDFLTRNFDTILNVVIEVTKAFVAFRSAQALVNTYFKSKDIVAYIFNIKGVRDAMKAAAAATKEEAAAQLAANRAMQANVFALVTSALIVLITEIDLFTSSTEQAKRAQEALNKAMQDSQIAADKMRQGYEQQVKEINTRYGKEIKAAEGNKDRVIELEEQKNKALIDLSSQYSKKFDAVIKLNEQDIEIKQKRIEDLQKRGNSTVIQNAINSLKFRIDKDKQNIEIARRNQQEYIEDAITSEETLSTKKGELTKEELEAARKALEEKYRNDLEDAERTRQLGYRAIEYTNETEEKKKELREEIDKAYYNERIIVDNHYYSAAKKLGDQFQDLQDKYYDDAIKSETDLAKVKNQQRERELEERRKFLEKLDEVQKQYDQSQAESSPDKFEKQRQAELSSFKERMSALDKEREEILKNDKITPEQRKKALEELNQIEINLKKDLNSKLGNIDESKISEDLQNELNDYQEYYDQRELMILNSAKTEAEKEKELSDLRKEHLRDEIKILQDYYDLKEAALLNSGKTQEEIDRELYADRKAISDKEKELVESDTQGIKQSQQKKLDIIKDFSSQALSVLDREVQNNNQKREQAIDREIQQREDAVNRQRELANKGVTNTLAFEDAQLAKAELKKAQQARKEARDQEKLTFLKLIQGYATEGKASESVRRALTDIALARVIEGSFFHGAENIADALGQPMRPGRDGYIVAVDGTERVMTGKQNEKVGDLSNEELADVARAYNTGELVPRFMTPTVVIPDKSFESANPQLVREVQELKSEMRGVKQAIENRPVTQWDVVSMFEIIEKRISKYYKQTIIHRNAKTRIF